jgi:hypothetical protein
VAARWRRRLEHMIVHGGADVPVLQKTSVPPEMSGARGKVDRLSEACMSAPSLVVVLLALTHSARWQVDARAPAVVCRQLIELGVDVANGRVGLRVDAP